MTQKQIATMMRKIEKHKIAIGKHRDELRAISFEIDSLCGDTYNATDALNEAIDALSRLV